MTDTVVWSIPDTDAEFTYPNRLPAADKDNGINVGKTERWISVIGGSALAMFGLSRRSPLGLALAVLGGGLIARGTTGHCSVYQALKASTVEGDTNETRGIHVEQAVTIDKPAATLYAFWRNFENLPNFMEHLKAVWVSGEKTSHWIVKGPAGKEIEWDAEIIHEIPDELIAWKTTAEADIQHAGSVRFVPAPGNRGCEVHVTLQYFPPAGVVGATVAKLFREEPSIQVSDDLRRFKRLMETGEIPTTVGQPHG